MKITLDRLALRDLIAKDPNFELEIRKSVLSEVARKVFDKDINKVIVANDKALFKAALDALQLNHDASHAVNKALESQLIARDSWYSSYKFTKDAQKVIDEAVESARRRALSDISNAISKTWETTLTDAIAKRVDASNIQDKINKRIDLMVDAEINRRVDAAVATKLEAMRKVL